MLYETVKTFIQAHIHVLPYGNGDESNTFCTSR